LSEKRPLADRWLDRLKNNPLIAVIIVVGFVVLGVLGFWERVKPFVKPGGPPADIIAQRAYLRVTGFRALRWPNEDSQETFEVTLQNSGNTPARIEARTLHLFSFSGALPHPGEPYRGGKDNLEEVANEVGHLLEVPAKGDAVLSTFLCHCLSSVLGNKEALLLGYLPYKDAFGDWHEVQFGWTVDLTDAWEVAGFPEDSHVGAFTNGERLDDETVQQILATLDRPKYLK